MNKKIRKHIIEYNKRKGWGITDEDIIETIREADIIYRETINERRHWNDEFVVCVVDSLLIGYNGARTTGDMSPKEKGWEFEAESICEVVEEKVIKTIYKKREIK